MVTRSSLKGAVCSVGDGLFTPGGQAVHSRGTGCSLQGDGLFTPGGRAIHSRGWAVHSRGDGLLALGGTGHPIRYQNSPPTDKPGI